MKQHSSFPWPDDHLAWTSYLSSLTGAWMLWLQWPWQTPAAAWALGIASMGAFLSSDWLSLRMGRSRQGMVAPSKSLPWQALALISIAALASGLFLWLLPQVDRALWLRVLVAVLGVLILVFVLRMEWIALDGRLLFLTHLLLTCPALLMGFLHWGVLSPLAFRAWIFPASFFPSQALFATLWFNTQERPGHAPSLISLPLLAGALALSFFGQWLQAVLLVLFLGRCLLLLDQRRADSLPEFRTVRRLTLELQIWSFMVLLTWLYS